MKNTLINSIVYILLTITPWLKFSSSHRHSRNEKSSKPNFVIIMADDLGWNDISLHGSDQFITPNIDSLGLCGVTLNRHYVPPMCTPSRAALMTGKYPIHTGMQHFVISSDEPWGLPKEEKILPQYLKEAGYNTHMVGKWHLGFHKKSFNPIQRGFDTFFGYLGPYIDYWDHSLVMLDKKYARGYDMRNNEEVYYKSNGTYATDLFTDVAVNTIINHNKENPLFLLISHLAPHTANENDPMQAIAADIEKFSYIENINRRKLADQGVGKVVKALKDNDLLDNTIILFYADNGAPTVGLHSNAGSNLPLRGQKSSPWEGAIRGTAAVFSPLIKNRERISDEYIHVADWFTTFIELAGINVRSENPNLDGLNVWNSISEGLRSPRNEIVHIIDGIFNVTSYTKNQFKYIKGTTSNGKYDGWLGMIPLNQTDTNYNVDYVRRIRKSVVAKTLEQYAQNGLSQRHSNESYSYERNGISSTAILRLRQSATVNCQQLETSKVVCNPLKNACLFNIKDDPCEFVNLASTLPNILNEMEKIVEEITKTVATPNNKPADPRANPAFHNNTWNWWLAENQS